MTKPAEAENANGRATAFQAGDLHIDVGLQQVTRGAEQISLPRLSFDLLITLIQTAPNLISIDDLMAGVWPGLVVSPETVSQRIKLLRDALGDDARAPRYIAGLRGRGYRFLLPVAVVSPQPRFPVQTDAAPSSNPAPSAGLAQPQARLATGSGLVAAVTGHPRAALLTIGCFIAVGALVFAATYLQKSTPARLSHTSTTALSVSPRTVAILPFESLNADHADDYLARGIPEVLVTRLGVTRELLVIASTSSFALKDKNIGAREIGRTLNAHYLVGGTVQRDGLRLRVTAHVMDAETGHELTALRFDRKIDDIFKLEDDIADQIAAALEVSITGFDAHRVAHTRSPSLDAYLAYLKGKASVGRWRVADSRRAMAEFERSIKLDPNFAPAYAELAIATIQSSWLRFQDNTRLADTVGPLIDKAITLDDRLGEAYIARGALKSKVDEVGAEADFRKGIALSPNYATGYAMFGYALIGWRRGKPEGREMIDRAMLIDPLSPQILYRRAHSGDGPDDFDHFMLEALKVDPDFFPALKSFGWHMFLRRRQTATAIKLTERAIQLDPEDIEIRHSACDMYLDVGDLAAAEQVIAEHDAGASSAPMMIAMYKGDWRSAGELAYSIPARLREESEGLEVGSAIHTYAVHTGDFVRAEAYLRELWKMRPGDELGYDRGAIYIADLMRRQGHRAAAQRILDALPEVIQKRPDFNFRDSMMGVLMVVTGRSDAGLELLTREVARMHHAYWYVVYGSDKLLDPVRDDPRFQAIVARERAYSMQQRALLEQMRQAGDVPVRIAPGRPRPVAD